MATKLDVKTNPMFYALQKSHILILTWFEMNSSWALFCRNVLFYQFVFSVASHLQRPLNPEWERFLAASAQAGSSQTPAVPAQNKQQTPQNCRDTSQHRVVCIFDALISDYLGLRLGFCAFFFFKIFSIARRGLTMRKMAAHLPAPAVVLILINPDGF